MPDPRDEKTVPPKVPIQETSSSADEHTAGLGGRAPVDDDFSFLEKPQLKDELGRLGSFRVLKELDRGGMGCVLLAEDTGLDRQVALKVMLPQFAKNEKAKTRFLREAKAAGKIHHDHVVTIYHVAESNEVPFIAMEFLRGMPLDRHLKEKGDVPLPMVLKIGREIALGLAEAHQLGMIHRDIKPANVWLESLPASPGRKAGMFRVKILDFGLARREEDGEAHLTQSGAIVGTPAYMAPEQATAEKLDGRADLFSLGVLLYRLATGQPAFSGPTTVAMLMQVATHEPALANAVKPGVSLEMGRIIGKLMAKKKEERYGSAQEFLLEWEKLGLGRAEGREAPGNEPAQEPITRGLTPLGSPKQRKVWPVLAVAMVVLVALVAWQVVTRLLMQESVAIKQQETPPPKVEPPWKEPPPLDATNAAEVQAAWAAKLKLPLELTNGVGMVLLLIPPGPGADYPYYLGKYEVTQGEWEKVMGYNPSEFRAGGKEAIKVAGMDTRRFPVEKVNRFDCVEYCNKLSEREKLPAYYELAVKTRKGSSIEEAEVKILGGRGYHITTDAEWEHGCRAGTYSKYCFGSSEEELQEYAWYDKTSGGRTHVVGELKANGFGLYDIHGNVREWNEEMLKKVDTGAPERLRGGGWNTPALYCAVSHRSPLYPGNRNYPFGLRLARVP